MRQALVTGANRGLGLVFVRRLLEAGGRVVAACRHPGQARELNLLAAAHPGHLSVLPLDLLKPRSIAELAREAAMVSDRLDLLVNNAGVLAAGERFGAVSPETLESSFRVNAAGPFLLTQALAPLLAASQAPKVLNLGSQMGSIAAVREFRAPSYAIAKAALSMATVQLAHALAPLGAVVLAGSPGWARTDMGGVQAELAPEEAVDGLLAQLERVGPADSGTFLDWRGEPVPW